MARNPHYRRRSATRREVSLTLLLGAALGFLGSNWPGTRTLEIPSFSSGPPLAASGPAVAFGLCHTGGGTNCVVDGDTFWLAGEKVRIADIDTPETHPPRCAEEAALGERATLRLRELLSAGPVALGAVDRATDRYGRRLAIVEAGGVPVGETLIEEGLARRWGGPRRSWCDQE